MSTFVERLLGGKAGTVVTVEPDWIVINDGVSHAAVEEISAVAKPEKVMVMPYGLMTDDERILLTANRNFIGRQGTKKTLGYLSSPTVAAATAVMGVVTDPADLPALA